MKSRMGKKGKKSRRGAAQLRDPWAGTRLQGTPEGERYESIFESLRENAHRDGAARADGLLVAQQYLRLDDDTSKPALPLTAPELYWREVERRAKWLDARPIRSWEALSAADRQPWIETSAAGSELYAAQVAFCAKSGSELLGEHFIDLCTKPPLTRWIVQMKEGAYDVSGGDKDATTYVTAVEGDRAWDPNKGDVVICVKLSLREVRARACGDKRAAKKAAKRNYTPIAAGEEPEDSMFLFGNGRVLTQSDMDTINMHSIAHEGDEFILQYIRRMVLSRFRSGGLPGAIRALRKWPRVKPHWARIRRRICHCCNEEADLSEPRYLVCSGCGEARYCSEACQRAHWAEHQKECPAGRSG